MRFGFPFTVLLIGSYLIFQSGVVRDSSDVHFALNWLTSLGLGLGGFLLLCLGLLATWQILDQPSTWRE